MQSLDRRRFLMNSGLTLAGLAATYQSVNGGPKEPSKSTDVSSWAGVREQFGVSPEYIHLSSFFLASHPAPVREAIEKHRRGLDANPFLYVEENGFGKPLLVETAVAEYVGGKPEEIALTDSTTMGLALVYLAPTRVNLQLTLERWPDLEFRETREHLAAAA